MKFAMNKKAMKVIRMLGVCSVMLTANLAEAKDILTATPVTYMVSSELTKGTVYPPNICRQSVME